LAHFIFNIGVKIAIDFVIFIYHVFRIFFCATSHSSPMNENPKGISQKAAEARASNSEKSARPLENSTAQFKR
jgi:hypothetical protein